MATIEPLALITWTSVIVSISVIVTALEDLSLKAVLFNDNLFDWRYCLSFQPLLRPSHVSNTAHAMFGIRAFKILALMRLFFGFALMVSALCDAKSLGFCIVLLIALYAYLFYRIPYSLDGSDQMTYFVLIGLIIMVLGGPGYVMLGASAIAIHAAICYLTSGIAKLCGPLWRSGSALPAIMASAEFGSKFGTLVLQRRPWLATLSSWLIIFGHLCAGICIILGSYFAIFGIVFSVAFHVAVALTMRLNVFIWGFAATYPSILYFGYRPRRLELLNEIVTHWPSIFR